MKNISHQGTLQILKWWLFSFLMLFSSSVFFNSSPGVLVHKNVFFLHSYQGMLLCFTLILIPRYANAATFFSSIMLLYFTFYCVKVCCCNLLCQGMLLYFTVSRYAADLFLSRYAATVYLCTCKVCCYILLCQGMLLHFTLYMQGMLLYLPFTFAKVCCCVYLLLMARYAAESDCRAFFTCAVYTNYHPRLSGCPVNTVFNPVKQQCDDPENVPNCKDYYKN